MHCRYGNAISVWEHWHVAYDLVTTEVLLFIAFGRSIHIQGKRTFLGYVSSVSQPGLILVKDPRASVSRLNRRARISRTI